MPISSLLEALPQAVRESPYAVPVAAVVVAALLALVVMSASKAPKDAPPEVDGAYPLLGHFHLFAKSPVTLISDAYKRYGSVYTVRLFSQKMTFLIGPSAASAFFKANDTQLGQDEVYRFMTPVFGKGVVYDSDPKKRNLQMKRTADALKSGRLKTYVEKIKKETEDFFASWPDEGTVDICEALSDLIILTASRCLHGDDVREELFVEVSKLYNGLDQGITPVSFLWPNAPIPAHFRRNAARKEMVKLFSKVIAARRAGGGGEERSDILQVFMDIEYADGTRITDHEVTGLLIALLFAGQHTSSITSSWTALYLANNKALQDRVYHEQQQVLGHDSVKALNFDKLSDLDLLFNCIREALRMHPPLIMLMRYCRQDLKVTSAEGKTYTVPKGNTVAVSPAVQHRLAQHFKDPESFDPDRFAPGREEHKTLFSYAPFGGGMHACLGQQFGLLQLKTVLSMLISTFEIELATDHFPQPNYHAMVVGPEAPCTIRYRRRKPLNNKHTQAHQ